MRYNTRLTGNRNATARISWSISKIPVAKSNKTQDKGLKRQNETLCRNRMTQKNKSLNK
jgi:hypothetical protein